MQTARVFKSGNSQAVRMPKAFRFASDEVQILRRGNDVILREKPKTMKAFVDALMALPEDFFDTPREDPPPQERDFSGLDEALNREEVAAKRRKKVAKRA